MHAQKNQGLCKYDRKTIAQNLMKQTNQQAETKPTLFPYSMQPNVVMFEQCFEIRLWKMFISFNMVIPVFLCKPHLDRLIFLLFLLGKVIHLQMYVVSGPYRKPVQTSAFNVKLTWKNKTNKYNLYLQFLYPDYIWLQLKGLSLLSHLSSY